MMSFSINKAHYVGLVLLIIHCGSHLLFKTNIIATYPLLYIITILVRLLSAFSLGVTIAWTLSFPEFSIFFRLTLIVLWIITALPGFLFILRYLFLIHCPLITSLRTADIMSWFCGFLIIPILKALFNHHP